MLNLNPGSGIYKFMTTGKLLDLFVPVSLSTQGDDSLPHCVVLGNQRKYAKHTVQCVAHKVLNSW